MKNSLEFMAVWILKCFASIFPHNFVSKTGGFIGRNLGPKLKRSLIVKKNLKNCGFDENLNAKVWENWAAGILEVPKLDQLLLDESRLEIIGSVPNRPAFYMSAHLGHILVQNIALKKLKVDKLCQLYHPRKNKLIDNLFHKIHSKWASPVAKGDVKSLMRFLKDGYSLLVLLDQKEDRGDPIDFFKMRSMTNTSLFKLALKLDMPIIPIQVIRRDSMNFKVIIHDQIEPDMKTLHTLFENWIRENPDQYFWFHNRWK